ncbi:hypothetical protein ACGFK1_25585 [Mycobacterium sp. NPDC048908]|uniref:hypothetical protein n=1 Tax=Mycobacterium sp. NPDC048908 TaxID=3364292 RepID=UPI00371A23F8
MAQLGTTTSHQLVVALLGVVSPVGVLHAPWLQAAGVAIGIAATVYAQLDMGDSWRIGVDPSETTTLVRSGVVFGSGIALATANPVAIAGLSKHGDAYRYYLADVGRLVPGIGHV